MNHPPQRFFNLSVNKYLAISLLLAGAGMIGTVQTLESSFNSHHGAIHTRPTIKTMNFPLMFETNQGQVANEVNFLARTAGYTMYFTPQSMVFDFRKTTLSKNTQNAADNSAVLRLQFIGANPHPVVNGTEKLPSKTNYFIGNDPKGWHTDVSNFARINYKNIYPGIDMVFYGKNNQLEYDIRVAPGVDPSIARFKFTGATDLKIDNTGALIASVKGDNHLQMHKPVIYQMIDGQKHPITGHFVLSANHEVGFQVGDYDKTKTLVIDPVLSYSTFLGGSEDNAGLGIAVDHFSDTHTYVTGFTKSTDFPVVGPFQATHKGPGRNAFVTKINREGTAIVYSTYLGGSGGNDEGFAIAVDGVGSAYITGETNSTDFPTKNPFQPTNNGAKDFAAFVTKLNPEGNTLVYSTYLGGSGENQEGNAITVDESGFAYVTGETTSTDFPLKAPFQATNKGPKFTAYVTKFNTQGTDLVFSTYLGGSGGQDEGNGIGVDSDGNVFITGETNSKDFPTLNAIQPTPGPKGAGQTGFLTRMTSNGQGLVFSTYFGGSGGNDYPTALAIGPNENIVIGGYTNSEDFPTFNAFQTTNKGAGVGRGFNGFITKFNHAGNLVLHSSYIGGSGGNDKILGVAVNRLSQIHFTGQSNSSDFPLANPLQSTNKGPNITAIGGRVDTDGNLISSTYFGGSGGFDVGYAITADADLNSIATGITNSSDFPLLHAIQPTKTATYMAVVVKVSP